jgi:transcription antitermination factor NusG
MIELPEWRVAHTRPRAEKKVVEECSRAGLECRLPLHKSVKRYRGKKLVFLKPLFPGYVFFKSLQPEASRLRQSRHIANLLTPPDQAEFEAQLTSILTALDTELEIRLAPQVVPGARVKIITGPLRGLEGGVVRREGMIEVILWLDFLGQGAAVKVAADELELA